MEEHLREALDSAAWGEKIRALREERGWSQRDLAERLDLHYTTVSEIERGRTQLTLERLNRVVEALGYRADVQLEPLERETRAEWGPILAEVPDVRRRIRSARELAETFADFLYEDYEVEAVYCFGSLAENGGEDFGEDSDVDLLVEGLQPAKLFEAQSRLKFDVAESVQALGDFGFDLVRTEDVELEPSDLVDHDEAVLLPRD